ncbi:prolyl 4-hydroxylase subunit alpha-2-like [Scaptodrosophila lebanonensis]|uniref:procollagen-proline 4-dioxygenase n=1 Tax=Drosophila lebanonensis TaxID=7225 RepID=A0A6J2T7W0_DROLE|nr:prolyl 4-hydroxylase subunit alpha-2-like [Scaptodrosophila lebanonensis]
MVSHLEAYIEQLEVKKANILTGIEMMNKFQNEAWTNVTDFVANPLNSFALIRHMQSDWAYWQLYMEEPVGEDHMKSIRDNLDSLPTDVDLRDAAMGITLIHDYYHLDVKDVARGLLAGVQYNATFSVSDCFWIAKNAYENGHFKGAEQWLLAALQANKSEEDPEPTEANIYEKLAEARLALGMRAEALKDLEAALDWAPTNARLLQKKQELRVDLLMNTTQSPEVMDFRHEDMCCSGLCSPRVKNMFCIYYDAGSPYLLLAPVKTELYSLDPYVALYHDVISPNDASFIRETHKLLLTPSDSYDVFTNTSSVSDYRTAKSVWYDPEQDEVIQRIEHLVGELTHTDTNASEIYQIINYGIGGHFIRHVDYRQVKRVFSEPDRLATMIFYLSDVPQGGATLFGKLDLAVFPKLGSALMFHVLNSTGDFEDKTEHTGCPVIVGSKWIMNKWIQYLGQEFKRPCPVGGDHKNIAYEVQDL